MFEIGYTHFVVILFLFSGGIALFMDVKICKRDSLEKEMKVTRWFGLTNLTLGLIIFLANWGYHIWFV